MNGFVGFLYTIIGVIVGSDLTYLNTMRVENQRLAQRRTAVGTLIQAELLRPRIVSRLPRLCACTLSGQSPRGGARSWGFALPFPGWPDSPRSASINGRLVHARGGWCSYWTPALTQ